MEFNATFLVSVISFIVFTILMNMIFYAPISKIIEERDKLVSDTLNDAAKKQSEADRLNSEREQKLSEASDEGRKIISETIDGANKESSKMTSEAKERSIIQINDQKISLLKQAQSIQTDLDKSAEEIAEKITTKILG